MNRESELDDRREVQEFLRQRSDEAFLRLYDRHADVLHRFAARLAGGPGAEPAEIVQDAWLRAIERLPEFRFRSSLRTWLCGIVLNRWREVRRSGERDGKIVALAAQEGGPERTVRTDPALTMALERALAGLPDGYREVLLLHDVEGYTHEEIAGFFGIVEGTSKSQLHRARRAMRDALAPKGAVHERG